MGRRSRREWMQPGREATILSRCPFHRRLEGGQQHECYSRRMNSRYLSRFILLIFMIATVANAQSQLHFGVEAGIPLTDTLSSTSTSSTSPTGFSIDRYNSETK